VGAVVVVTGDRRLAQLRLSPNGCRDTTVIADTATQDRDESEYADSDRASTRRSQDQRSRGGRIRKRAVPSCSSHTHFDNLGVVRHV